MKEAFEKILERFGELHERYVNQYGVVGGNPRAFSVKECMEIVQEVSEEYNGGWIACSERLPEKNGMYLCTQNTYDLVTNKKIIRVSTELVEFYNGKWRRAKNLVVTHWQPLPEPYNERD